MSEKQICPVCRGPAAVRVQQITLIYTSDCALCGKLSAFESLFLDLSNSLNVRQSANIRGFLDENPDRRTIRTSQQMDFLRGLSSPSVMDKAYKVLKFIVKHFPEPGCRCEIPRGDDLNGGIALGIGKRKGYPFDFEELTRASWASGPGEVEYLIEEVLWKELGFVQFGRLMGGMRPMVGGSNAELKPLPEDFPLGSVVITPKGWVALDGLVKSEIPDECFVAMWFSPEVDTLFADAIYPGAEDAGYRAIRVDKIDHNNKIDDEIIAGIRRGKFLIADFTGQRGGVYFEAGFAMGLGKQIIWLVREDEINKIHFDNRQYNFTTWSLDDLPALRRKIQLRIEATIGRGPYTTASDF